MKKLAFCNIDYRPGPTGRGHSTDEGEQLQSGLIHAGWHPVGFGFDDGCTNVSQLLDRHHPDLVWINDCRDFSPSSGGCFDPRVEFKDIEAFADSTAFVSTVFKDAGSVIEFQRRFMDTIQPDALTCYYHDRAITKLSPWCRKYERIRIHHSVDSNLIRTLDLAKPRKRAIVTGAVSDVYPLRQLVMQHSRQFGVDVLRHPGYSNKGSHTADYLRLLSTYKVHVATASRFCFALRKLIESVAVGCVCITDLPEWDVLPEIDDALVRVPSDIAVPDLAMVIRDTAEHYDLDKALHFSRLALERYDWRETGRRLDRELTLSAEALHAGRT